MKRMTLSLVAAALLGVSLLAAAPAEAASSAITIVGPNGPVATEVAPYVVRGTTLVPINVIGKLGIKGLSTQWDNKLKMVTVVDGADRITLKLNEAFAMKGTDKLSLGVPASVKNGRVMVPLRFIGESIGEQVNWSPYTRTITIGVAKDSLATSSELTQQRVAALKLPKVMLKDQLEGSGISFTTIYFPVGKSDAFFVQVETLLSYYQVKDGKAVQIWSATGGSEAATNKGLPLFPYKIDQEIGERPDIQEPVAFFKYVPMVNSHIYGIIDENGKAALQAAQDEGSTSTIIDIPEESKYLE